HARELHLRPVSLIDWIGCRESLLEHVHRRRGARRVDAGTKADESAAVDVQAALQECRFRGERAGDRLPEVGRHPGAAAAEVRVGEAARHHAADRRRGGADENRFPERRRIASELMHEIGIREYAYLLRARLLVVRGKPAAEQWLDAGQLEEAGGDEGDRLPLRTIRAWGEDGVTSDEREPFDRVVQARRLVLPILDRGI